MTEVQEAGAQWLESVVREWAIALRDFGVPKEVALASQHYIDGEYPPFTKPKPLVCLQAFYAACGVAGEDKGTPPHPLSDGMLRMLMLTEAAYRMGFDDGSQKQEEPAKESKDEVA